MTSRFQATLRKCQSGDEKILPLPDLKVKAMVKKKQKFQQALSREAVTLHDTFWSPEINPSSLQKKLFLRIGDSFF